MRKLLTSFKLKLKSVREKQPSVRERFMLIGLLVTALGLWGLSLSTQYRNLAAQNAATRNAIAQNEIILGTQGIVEKRLGQKAQELHHSAEISGTDLLSVIGTLGADAGLKPESSRPVSKSETPFDIITVRITLRNAPLESLIEFDERISNEFPSIAVTEARFSPTSDDGMTLNATYEITSFLLQADAQKKLR